MFLIGIEFYRVYLGPVFGGQCRFTPSCSEYSMEAIRKNGSWKGIYLSLCRICKCHPFSKSGMGD